MTAENTAIELTGAAKFYDASALRKLLKEAGLPSGNTWLHKSIKDGTISSPIKIGGRNYWARDVVESEIAEWHAQAVAVAKRVASV